MKNEETGTSANFKGLTGIDLPSPGGLWRTSREPQTKKDGNINREIRLIHEMGKGKDGFDRREHKAGNLNRR
jgi:hypothetical protein